MDEDDTVNHYEANYQFIFTWSMIRLVFYLDSFHFRWFENSNIEIENAKSIPSIFNFLN